MNRAILCLSVSFLAVLFLACKGGNKPAPKNQAGVKRNVVGEWVSEDKVLPGRITIFRDGDKVLMEKVYKDGSKGLDEMVEVEPGKKFMDAQRTGERNDYWWVTDSGDLEIWSYDDRLLRHVVAIKGKRVK
jgi:hypothetical protein